MSGVSNSRDPTRSTWEAEQQHRFAALESMVANLSEAVERMARFVAPTPTVTPQPLRATTLPSVPVPEPLVPAPQPPPTRSAKVSPPDMFTGDRHKLHIYLSKCRHNFLSRPELFASESQKVLFASGYLDGAAYNWFQPLLDQYAKAVAENIPGNIPEEFQSFEGYTTSLENTFGDPDLVRAKERELCDLRQITSVASYLAEFNRIKGFVEWNDQALTNQFYRGLKSNVKDGLVYERPAPKTLSLLTAAALRVDNRYFERILERKAEAASQSQPHRASRYPPVDFAAPLPRPKVTVTPPAPRPTAPLVSDGSTPMELDLLLPYPSRVRGPLSNEEKQRRRELNLCHYCASPNHRIQACPLAPARSQPPQQVRLAQRPEPSEPSEKDPAQE